MGRQGPTPRPTEDRTCAVCGEPFRAIKAHNGSFPKCCSAACQVVKVENMILALLRRRDVLLARIGGER